MQCVDLGQHFTSDRVLRHVVQVDARAVLRTAVVALAVQRGRVVDHEEDFEHFTQADLARVERDTHHLVVPGRAGADLLVARVHGLAVAVTRLNLHNAFEIGRAHV